MLNPGYYSFDNIERYIFVSATKTFFSMNDFIRKKTLRSFIVLLLFSWNQLSAQFTDPIEVTPCQTTEEVLALIDTVFLAGVNPQSIDNISFTGDPRAVGYFKNGYFTGFETPEGIILTTGLADDADESNVCSSAANANTNNNGPNSEPDLAAASGGDVNDACVIEFDFRPTADTVRFNYLFASEEYHDYVFSYNDVFGFFLAGDGLNGPYTNNAVNIAIVPGTNLPVAINNINFGKGGITCTGKPPGCTNCQYMVDNSQQSNPEFKNFVYDGYTTALEAKSAVTQCQWYHIKIAISDVGDDLYDSGVLLEKGSFNPGNVSEVTQYTHPTIDSLVYEGCNNHEAVLYFSINEPMGFPYIIPFEVGGTATRDIDYRLTTTHPGDTIYIPAGQTYDSIIVMPYTDTDPEGIEDVLILYNSQMCNVFSQRDTAAVYISDRPDFTDTNLVFPVFCEDTAVIGFDSVLNGIPPYAYDWYTLGQTTPTVLYAPSGTDSVIIPVVIYDTCGYQVSDTAFVKVPPLQADAGPAQSLCNQPSDTLHGSCPGGQNYFWESNPNDPTLAGQEHLQEPVVSPVVSTDYYLTVTDNCTNEDRDTTSVLLEGAVADAGEDTEICLGDTAELMCNTAVTYNWSANPPDPSLSNQDTARIIHVSPAQTTTYTVTITNECGFSASDEVTVTVLPLPAANAGPDDHVCKGMDYPLTASGGIQYQWSSDPYDASLFVNGQDTTATPLVSPDTTTTYYVSVNDGRCSNTDTMVLTVDPVPNLSLTVQSDTLCYGSSTTLTANGSAEYTWSAQPPDPSLTGQEHNATVTVSPDTTTVYTLTGVVSGYNCPATLKQTVVVKPELSASFITPSDEICQGEQLVLNYTGNAGPQAEFSFDWSQEGTLSGNGTGPYTFVFDSAGIQQISLTVSENGCTSQPFNKMITVYRTPESDFTSDIREGCEPVTVRFTNLTGNQSDPDFYWNFGTGESSTEENPVYTFNEPGTYTVYLKVTNNGLCHDTKTQNAYIQVHALPQADFEPDPQETVLEEATITFNNSSTSPEQFGSLWFFGDGDSSTLKNPTHTYTATGIYNVLLRTTTAFGCIDETSREVIVHPDFSAYAPNSFSPNGDGLNDKFEIVGTGIKKFKLQIYSRWGELLFESNSLEEMWDGTSKGKLVPRGTYVYKMFYTTFLGKSYQKEGTVTVIY